MIALSLWNGHGHSFLLQLAGPNGLAGPLLASEREKILIFSRDVKFFGDVFAGFRHGVDPVLCFHQRVDEPPAERGVFHFHGTREGGVALATTKGARDMLSTPPAITRSASPDLIARAAVATASMLDPQRRLTVVPGTSLGRPASKRAIRATLRLSSPA